LENAITNRLNVLLLSAQGWDAGGTPDLSVSVVTYNSAHCLDAFFESLSMQQGVRWELFLVDNASTDRTAARLQDCAIGNLTLNPRNIGYGGAHNQNRSHFRGRHVLFLNPDQTLAPQVFERLVRFLDENPRFAVAGPKVIEGPERVPFPPRRFYPGEGMIVLERGIARHEYAWVSGCCLAIRRSVLDEIGGFDPDYFLYQEETDLCLRVRRAGYKIGWCPEVEVLHAGGQSQAHLSEYEQARRLFDGTALFWEKHYPSSELPSMVRFQYLAARAFLALGGCWRWLPGETSRQFRPERMRARRDVCGDWLKQRQCGVFPWDPGSLKIAVRQVGLLFEWLRRGGFPLDDY
jgi:hypothetical protein